jgi:hypothetical protein
MKNGRDRLLHAAAGFMAQRHWLLRKSSGFHSLRIAAHKGIIPQLSSQQVRIDLQEPRIDYRYDRIDRGASAAPQCVT